MATTTPNFGWSVPTSTDLVKDGATAIELLGDSIDASLVDLKGGTTGQVLAKTSGTDMDFTWVTTDDTNAIQNAIVDAKGDLIGASAADTPARLAVGANGTVLTADSAEATGLKWATPATGSTFVGAFAKSNATLTISNNVYQVVTWNGENFDSDNFHSTVTNTSRMTIPAGKGGKYLINAQVRWDPNTTGQRFIRIYKNGSALDPSIVQNTPTGGVNTFQINQTVNAAAADYFEIYVQQGSGGNLNLDLGGDAAWFCISYLGA